MDTAISTFQQALRGRLVLPTDADYDDIRALYFARLAKVKAKYDPANLFRVNQNIQPART